MRSVLIKHGSVTLIILLLTILIIGCGSGRFENDEDETGTSQTQASVESISLSTDKNSVPTDNSEPATITAQVTNSDNVGVENSTVQFSASTGLLSKNEVVTDSNGEASVKFYSGKSNVANRISTIIASAQGAADRQIPIKITGTSMSLDADATDISKDSISTLTVNLQDASEVGINDAKVRAEVVDGQTNIELGNSTTSGDYITGFTDYNGDFYFAVNGTAQGNSTIQVDALNITQRKKYSVVSPKEVLKITDPSESPTAVHTNEGTNIQASVPKDINEIVFSTSLGEWAENERSTYSVTNNSGNSWTAQATFNATKTGTATIEVYDKENPQNKESINIASSAPSSQAGQIDLQVSATNVLPSTGGNENTVKLSANVRTNASLGGVPVGNAPVLFSLNNATGGGEYISPTTVYTNSSGLAVSTFTAGSSSSDSDGVTVSAEVLDDNYNEPNIKDNKSIVIGGRAGSISIGVSTEIRSTNDDTVYELPMSVLVTDSNGNAMENTKVYLSAWPTRFRTGFWDENNEAVIGEVFENEDENRNLIEDPGEDCSSCNYTADNQLTPPQSSAGSLPSSVTTNENGLANFELTYLKEYAVWIESEIKASTEVLGTESITTYKSWLRYQQGEEDNLPDSPFNPEE